MRTLHVIMPMAGEGSRFLKEGWSTPKPLIMLDDVPLFIRALNSIQIDGVPMKYSFIVRKEHIDKYNLEKKIKSYIPDSNVFYVEQTTRGAVETCLLAESKILYEESILVLDCDLEFKSKMFIDEIKTTLGKRKEEVEGGVLVGFKSKLPKYSYAEVDKNGYVVRTAEKEVISNNALCGAYFFSSGQSFLENARNLLSEPNYTKQEYYISLLFNYLLKAGQKVKLVPMEEYRSFGTPEEFNRYI